MMVFIAWTVSVCLEIKVNLNQTKKYAKINFFFKLRYFIKKIVN